MKKVIILMLIMSMTMSILAYPISAEAIIDHETEKATLEYVSIGDSMTNGIGMVGYDATGKNGYLEVAPDAYPAQFAEWIKEYTAKDVNLTQLATSAARAEDVWYILTRGTEHTFEPDYWTQHELLWNSNRWGSLEGENRVPGDKHFEENAKVAETYQDAIANADIISYSMGNANFGIFLLGRIWNIIGLGSEEDRWPVHYAYMTLDNAIDLISRNENINNVTLINDMKPSSFVEYTYNCFFESYIFNHLSEDARREIADYAAYTTASFMVSYAKTMDLIIDMNPDVTILLMPLVNSADGLEFVVGDTHIDFGDNFNSFYSDIYQYMTNYIELKQLNDEANEATFLNVEFTGQVEMFAQVFTKLYGELPENVTKETYPAGRAFCHNRFFSNIQDFVMPILLGGTSADYYGAFTDIDIINYEIAKANGIATFVEYVANNSKKAELISYYLGIVDAILASIDSKPIIDSNEISIDSTEEFSILGLIGGEVIPNLQNKVYENLENMLSDGVLITEIYGMVGYDLNIARNFAALYVVPDVLSKNLTDFGVLEMLFSLYGRVQLGWGLASHPSAEGHDTMTQALINAYVNKTVVCCHMYDDCMDATCNLCEKERDVIGHDFTNYVYNNDGNCTQNGTETAKCNNCEATDTKEAIDSATGHSFENGTCRLCGESNHDDSTPNDSNNNNHQPSFLEMLFAWIINFFAKLFGLKI